MAEENEKGKPEAAPPGHFTSDDLRDQTARFIEELKKRLRREQSEEPRLGPPR